MILNHQEIISARDAGGIVIEPFTEAQVQAATYDLRVGGQGATTSTKKLIDIEDVGYITLEPGDFGVVIVLEEIRLGPQYAARFGLRSKFARKGLIATTGPQIDPGFHGRLIIGLTNLTPKPVSIAYKDDFVSIEFHKLESETNKPYSGPYQDKMQIGPEEIEFITETEKMALSDMLTTLGSLSSNVAALTTEVRILRWLLPAIVAIGIGVIGVIVGVK